MRTRILTLLAAASLAVATLATAPAASAATTWTDLRSDATVTDLPFTSTADLTAATVSSDDPTDCAAPLAATTWGRIHLTGATTVLVNSNLNDAWGYGRIAFYPDGQSTAVACLDYTSTDTPVRLAAGTYDVLVASLEGWGVSGFDVAMATLAPPAHDDWADAEQLTLPTTGAYDMRAATLQPGEPAAPCAEEPAIGSQWYSFTAPAYGWIEVSDNWTMTNAYALYTASPGGGAPVYAGQCARTAGTLRVTPGATYLLQVEGYSAIAGTFSIAQASPLRVRIGYWPDDPSVYDSLDISVYTDNGACSAATLNYGDGSAPTSTTDCLMSGVFAHRYAKDGRYTLTANVVAQDGRTSTVTTDIAVVTHDVAVASLTAPKTAAVGKSKQVSVSVGNLGKYAESTFVHLYSGTPETGWTLLGSATVPLPVSKKAVSLTFTWIPAASDVGTGVRLKAVVDSPYDTQTQSWLRDARPENNELSSAPIKVSR